MTLYHVINGLLRVNTYYLVNEQTGGAVLIDCGENLNTIRKTEKECGFKVKAVLLTHAHFDHSGCAKDLQEQGAKIYISKIDAPKLSNEDNLGSHFGRKNRDCVPDYTFQDGDELIVEGFKLKVIATPGHTDGSVCFIMDNIIFSGDTLFKESVGRTDFPTGDSDQLVKSVLKLLHLEGDYNVYPGHEEFTTLSHERKFNMFVEFE
ncbi:MAG: MBL fold metallo-hydrolase [Clostridia bacterium]|nr:MBL fold metallo-hydrolase [Clostridia bacterium]